MAEMIFVSSLVANTCFIEEDDPAISVLVGTSAVLRVEPVAREEVVLWFIFKYHRNVFIWSKCEFKV